MNSCKTFLIISLILLFIYPSLEAQNFHGLDIEDIDSIRIKKIIDSARYYKSRDIRKYGEMHKRALDLSLLIDCKHEIAWSYGNIGTFYSMIGKYDSAIWYYNKKAKFAQRHGVFVNQISYNLNMGNLFSQMNQFDSAFYYSRIARSLAVEKGDTMRIAKTSANLAIINHRVGSFNDADTLMKLAARLFYLKKDTGLYIKALRNIGDVNFQQKDYGEALKVLHRARRLAEITGMTIMIGRTYTSLGNVYGETKRYDSAQYYYEATFKIKQATQDTVGMISALGNLGVHYKDIKEFGKSKEFSIRSLELAKEIGDWRHEAAGNINLAFNEIAMERFDRATNYALAGLQIGEKYNSLPHLRQGNWALTQAYEGNERPLLALKALKEYQSFTDSLYSLEKIQQSSFHTAKFHLFEKDQEIRLRQSQLEKESRKRQTIIAISTIIVALVIIAFFVARNIQKIRFFNTELRLKNQALQAQMNPHFLSHALDSIKRCMVSTGPEQAGKYLDDFYHLMRITLENSEKELIPLEEELEALNHYLHLEKLRNPNLNFKIDIQEEIDQENTLVPPLLFQPFVENGIEHGIEKIPNMEGIITIRIHENAHNLLVEVENEGEGDEELIKKIQNPSPYSFATRLTNERLNVIAQKWKKVSEISYAQTLKGLKVKLKLPLIKAF
ncbi:MAG: tetratricopeptide repeat protein [Bacteroidota bacterium]